MYRAGRIVFTNRAAKLIEFPGLRTKFALRTGFYCSCMLFNMLGGRQIFGLFIDTFNIVDFFVKSRGNGFSHALVVGEGWPFNPKALSLRPWPLVYTAPWRVGFEQRLRNLLQIPGAIFRP